MKAATSIFLRAARRRRNRKFISRKALLIRNSVFRIAERATRHTHMDIPINNLKRALQAGRPQIGLWSSLSSHVSVEIIAGSGFDWLLLDTEHAPNELTMVHQQLQAMTGGTATAVVRPAWNDAVIFKRLLDIGVQSLLVPMVQTAEEAQRAVAATRYPPQGIRGVAVAIRARSEEHTSE